jgi:hypothetical protein
MDALLAALPVWLAKDLTIASGTVQSGNLPLSAPNCDSTSGAARQASSPPASSLQGRLCNTRSLNCGNRTRTQSLFFFFFFRSESSLAMDMQSKMEMETASLLCYPFQG